MAVKPRKSPAKATPSGARPWRGVLLGAALVGVLVAGGWAWFFGGATKPVPPAAPPRANPVIPDQAPTYAAYAGSASCRECHEEAFALWEKSNHGLAERPLDAALDRLAFDPPRQFRHGSQLSATRMQGTNYLVSARGLSRSNETHAVARVIGHDPLRQFLVPFPGGRLQTLEASYDPHRNEWFNVYGTEDRQPGEWGHWTGRGMNWNVMCAGCHNVRVRKNYDEAADAYHTAWVEHGVGCESCHGPLQAHVEWRKAHPDKSLKDPTIPPMPWPQMRDTCAGCHARRSELTGDLVPGESFFDHHLLAVVDESDTYYPDGQVRDEDYEFAAFLGSKMGHAGVRCVDCHNPHSMKTILPGNWLCLRCHNGSYTNAPVIDPVSHSHHRVFGYDTNGVPQAVDLTEYDPRKIKETGGECVACHMPITNYMQRHPRHDHGFTIPDPLLTQQLGIPNACNRCHTDKSVDWALDATEKWYGPKMERPSRARTQTLAAARQGDPAARAPLLNLLGSETNAFWQAVAAGLLGQWADDPAVTPALLAKLDHPHPLVREKTVRALDRLAASPRPEIHAALTRKLDDPSRSVRVAAAWALRERVDLNSRAGAELQHFLDLNADQPTGQLQKGIFEYARGNLPAAVAHAGKAVAWDPNSAPLRHELAVMLSAAGRPREALEQLQAACRLAPREAEYAFKLALAWNELDNLAETVAALEKAVALEPRHARAWYNLGLARSAQNRPGDALDALQRAESAAPDDAHIPYARATVLARLARNEEAREAARRALQIDPGFTAARELLDHVPAGR